MTRILLFVAQRALAESLAERFDAEPDLAVVGAAATPPQARASVGWLHTDVAVVDVEPAHVDAGTIRSLIDTHPAPRVVLLADEASRDDLVPYVLAGANGWVQKSAGVDELLATIRGVASGETRIPGQLLTTIVESYRRCVDDADGESSGLRSLTERERDVLACMVAGRSRAQIAADLVLSENTVRTHAQHVLRKLGVHSSLAAVALARQAGMRGRGPARQALSDGYSR